MCKDANSYNHVIPTYNRLPTYFSHGQGSWLYDKDNTPYLDMLCGVSVTNLGHAHPRLVECLSQQSQKLWHTSNIYCIENQEKLAQKLCTIAQMKQAFFCNSGAEANETAIKIARLYGRSQGVKNPAILTFERSFHGRTMATLSATGNNKIQQGFDPLLDGFYHAQINDQESVHHQLNKHPNIVAIFIEPVQGEGGIHSSSADFLRFLQHLSEQQGLLLMFDEIQCGMARTGSWYAHRQANVTCDVVTNAKALGNGFPIGACLINHKAVDVLSAGKHGSTFGGNPLASTIAYEVLTIMEEDDIFTQVQQNTHHFYTRLCVLERQYSFIQAVRMKGLMIGIDIDTDQIDSMKIVLMALKNKLLINLTADKTIRLLPPLNCTAEEIEIAIERLEYSLKQSTLQQP